MKYLITLLIVRFAELVVIEEIEGSMQIFVWNVFLLTQPILLSLAVNQYVYDKKVKIVNFVALLVSIVMLVNFLSEWVFYGRLAELRLGFTIFIFLVMIPLCANAVYRVFALVSSAYDKKKSFVALKRPGNLTGLIVSLVASPYGHCSLVTKGKHFKFTKGIITESDYVERNDVCLVEIKSVSLTEARKLLHTRWSLINNCFTIFNKYKRTYAL